MRIRNLTGKGQNIGHGPNNPAYLDDSRVLELIQQAYDEGYTGVRFNWAFDSMCPEPGVFHVERLLFIVEALASRGMIAWAVHQAGPYPNQPKWRAVASGGTWHPCLPYWTLQQEVLESINEALKEVWWWLTDNGYDPRQAFYFQAGNEHGDGGVGDPTRDDYTKPKSGTGKLSIGMASWLERLMMGVNTLGMPLIGPGMECQADSMRDEIWDITGRPWMRRADIIDVHCYDDVDGNAVDKARDLLAWIGQRDEFTGGRPVWIGETGGKGDPRQQCNALLALGVEAVGWLG